MGKPQTLWLNINTAFHDGSTVVVAAGLLSCTAVWDGSGWFSKSLGRYIKATHWHPFYPPPGPTLATRTTGDDNE